MSESKETVTERTGILQALRIRAGIVHERFCLTPLSTFWARGALALWGASVGKGLKVRGRLRLHVEGRLEIHSNVRMNSASSNFVGGDQHMALWVGPGAALRIGEGCAMSNSTIVCLHGVTILPETFIGGGCQIYDTDFHPIQTAARIGGVVPAAGAPIVIGPRAFIGAGSLLLKGVTIGEGSVIGAGSLVTRPVPPREIWAGVPAKFIRKVEQDDRLPREVQG